MSGAAGGGAAPRGVGPEFCHKALGRRDAPVQCGAAPTYDITLKNGYVVKSCDEHMGGFMLSWAAEGASDA